MGIDKGKWGSALTGSTNDGSNYITAFNNVIVGVRAEFTKFSYDWKDQNFSPNMAQFHLCNIEVPISERPKELSDKTSQRQMTTSDVTYISILAKYHCKSQRSYTQ